MWVNNNGNCVPVPEDATHDLKDLFLKAQTLVHYSYEVTDHKHVLLDIQGSEFTVEHRETTFVVAIAVVLLLQLFSQTM